jgi:hypothetical protein
VLTPREVLIRELCERFSLDHFSLDGDEPFWARVKKAFTDVELVEATVAVAAPLEVSKLVATPVLNVRSATRDGSRCASTAQPRHTW